MMKPNQTSNQTSTPLTLPQPQVNAGMNQQMYNANVVAGLFPNGNNMPNLPPSGFMNFPNFPLQIGPNGNLQQNFSAFPVTTFNPSQLPPQQQGQFFAQSPMNPTAAPYNQNVGNEQALLQSTIQNIYQLLQLQNRNNAPQCPPPVGNFPMLQNPIGNVTSLQNPGFIANQQFGMSIPNRPVMAQQLQGNPFLPGASGLAQAQQLQNFLATATNFQNQISLGVGPQNQNFPANQMFGMPNLNSPMQHLNQGQQRFPAPMMNANISRQMVSTGQTHNPGSSITNIENNNGNMATNANGGRPEGLHKNFTGHKGNDASHKGFKSQFHHTKHVKEKGGIRNGIMNKVGTNEAVDSGRNSTSFKKLPSLNYTEQEIKQWREARKKNFPTSASVEQKCKKAQALSDATNQEAILRRQQLQDILSKQAELGCEVAEVPPSYFSGLDNQKPRDKNHEREPYKKGKFQNKRGRFKDNRTTKRRRAGDQDSFKANNRTHEPKPNEPEPSLLQKLLTRDIKRDKYHLLQVLRFIAVNSFFNGEADKPLRFPSVVVRETSSGVPDESTFLSRCNEKLEEKELDDEEEEAAEEEGEITD
uniref:uncharacterized protein LOC122588556 n=1 Tax=Erigeron canadensis TaxID=72917 RepID=UPI001CB9B549|nr:uncharacterized protein LOC122588556 [Erigeron canadensis]